MYGTPSMLSTICSAIETCAVSVVPGLIFALYRLETQVTSGNGGLRTSGLGSNAAAREAIKVGYDYFKANASGVSASIKTGDHDCGAGRP